MPFDPASLAACVSARWSPTIGDASVWGWATVAAYLIASVMSFAAATLRHDGRRETAFWVVVGCVMAALAVNKQLDLQSALTAAGRCLAQAQGWYEQRRAVQRDFVLALAAVSALVCLVGLVSMRRSLARCGVAVIGACLVVGWVMIRAVGFHHVDALLSRRIVQGVAANPVLELTGIALVALNAAALLLSLRRPRARARARGRR